MRTGRRLPIAALTLVAVFGAVSLGRGDTYPGANQGGADNDVHWACWVPNPGTSSIPFAAWEYVFGYLDTGSVSGVTVPWSGTCAAGTDMFLDDRLADASLLGLRTCRVPIVNGICNESNVMINNTTIQAAANSQGLSVEAVREHNWCHEGGHSLGLNHDTGNSQCMRTGVRTWTVYNTHDLGHLNNNL